MHTGACSTCGRVDVRPAVHGGRSAALLPGPLDLLQAPKHVGLHACIQVFAAPADVWASGQLSMAADALHRFLDPVPVDVNVVPVNPKMSLRMFVAILRPKGDITAAGVQCGIL